MKQPFFEPFEGSDYRSPRKLPGRLLVVGESYYLKEQDKHAHFTRDLMADVMKGPLMPGWTSRYYKNLFYILTRQSNREVTQEEWSAVWNSLAFYIFIQTTELNRARSRPSPNDWEQAQAPFQTVLAELEPNLILFTGTDLFHHATKIPNVQPHQDRPGLLFPTRESAFAYARCIYHPSSVQFLRKKEHCAQIFDELVARRSA